MFTSFYRQLLSICSFVVKGAESVVTLLLRRGFLLIVFHIYKSNLKTPNDMELCKKCKGEKTLINSCSGMYYKCIECGEISYPTSNSDFGTYDDNELDYISDRRRD